MGSSQDAQDSSQPRVRTPDIDRDWPHLDIRSLPGDQARRVSARQAALQAYARGVPLRQIHLDTGVAASCLYRCLAKAQRVHADGRLWGYRALLPHLRVGEYERLAEPKRLTQGKAGNAGAFNQLLERHPSLKKLLLQQIRSGGVRLVPSGDGARLKDLKGLARRFQKACLDLGLTMADYPLNQKDRAIRSLARKVYALLGEQTSLAAAAASARIKPESALREQPRDAPQAFDTVEFDAHKLDLRLKLILGRDPSGAEHSVQVERAWLLVIIDVATRCVLGWHLAFGKECNRHDVIEAFRRAVLPATRPNLTIPGARLLDAGGYVSTRLEQTRYALWRQVRLDNARAHLSAAALELMCDTLGAQVDFGPAYEPDDRPFIERYFGTVVQTFSRRLPGAIEPRGTADKARLLRRIGRSGDERLVVSTAELDELLAMMVWNYNGSPHSSLGGLTPLEVMEHHVLGIEREPVRLRYLPGPLQREPRLMHQAVDCVVHGNPARGERPHLSYLHVRYTGAQLARRGDLVGEVVRLHADPYDLRRVTVVTQTGEILEPLLAAGAWGHHPHSIWVRRQCFATKREKQHQANLQQDDPIGDFVAQRRKAAKTSKRAATELAKALHQQGLRAAPIEPFAGAEVAASTPGVHPALGQLAKGPVKGKDLKIIRGFTR